MRLVTFGGAASLDSFFAREDDAVDWLLWGKEVASISAAYWKTIDTVVMGRRTYEVAVKGGTTAYPGVKNYVFSKTMWESPDERVEIVASDAAAFVEKLKRQTGKGFCVMGGGRLANALFEADLIDEVGLNVHPVLLGSGIPAFLPMRHQVNLELLECTPFENGCVYVRYRVKR
jgi:dihydrofolate reductase